MHSYINFARFKRKMFWPDDIFLINLGEFSPEIKYACHRYVGYINEDVMSCILLQHS